MRIIFTLIIILALALGSCSQETKTSNENSKLQKESQIQTSSNLNRNISSTDSTSPTSESTSTNNTTVSKSKPPLRTDGKWVQIDARLYYIQGTIIRLEKNQKGKTTMTLQVEKQFQSTAGGAECPYEIGKEYSFLLKELPKMNLMLQKVIVYGGGVSTNDHDRFMGAKIVYYERKHQFYDFNGKVAPLPPTNYPYQL